MADGAVKVGLIGYGYWGQKLARVLHKLGVLAAICDIDSQRLTTAHLDYPNVRDFSDPEPFFNDAQYETTPRSYRERVVIATPPETHYELAKKALEHGLGVFVEKPLATTYQQAKELEDLATEKKLPLMVGHIYLHSPGIQAIPVPVGAAELYVRLLNPGPGPSPSSNDLRWAALPHAVALVIHFLHIPDRSSIWILEKQGVARLMEGPDQTGIRVVSTYWNGSKALIEVANETDRRVRSVELRVGNTRYCFDGDKPQLLIIRSGIETRDHWWEGNDQEPLVREMEAFLKTQEVDTMGSRVVKLIEELCDKDVPQRG